MMDKKKIKALIFDYGEVICPQDRGKINEMKSRLMPGEKDFSEIYFRYRLEYDLNNLSPEGYWKKVLHDCNVSMSDREIEELIKIDIKSWLSVDKRMLSFIREIKYKVSKIAILSNMPLPILEKMEESFHWLSLFDTIIFSCRVGSVKPEPEIYRMCLSKLALKAEDCLFIDDSEKNIAGAQKIGMNTIHYTSFDNFKESVKKNYILNGSET
ncbi:MAG: HAD family phosphatase [Candidatus Eremiobacterota bacterium]